MRVGGNNISYLWLFWVISVSLKPFKIVLHIIILKSLSINTACNESIIKIIISWNLSCCLIKFMGNQKWSLECYKNSLHKT
jgi:hypothetical protein